MEIETLSTTEPDGHTVVRVHNSQRATRLLPPAHLALRIGEGSLAERCDCLPSTFITKV